MEKTGWEVFFSKKARKGAEKLPGRARQSLIALVQDIEANGPAAAGWPNYGKLSQTRHHCHLKKGQPTYVAVWEVTDKKIRIVEVIYVGTHEKAPY